MNFICSCHSNIKFICSRHRVISSIYRLTCNRTFLLIRAFITPKDPSSELNLTEIMQKQITGRILRYIIKATKVSEALKIHFL